MLSIQSKQTKASFSRTVARRRRGDTVSYLIWGSECISALLQSALHSHSAHSSWGHCCAREPKAVPVSPTVPSAVWLTAARPQSCLRVQGVGLGRLVRCFERQQWECDGVAPFLHYCHPFPAVFSCSELGGGHYTSSACQVLLHFCVSQGKASAGGLLGAPSRSTSPWRGRTLRISRKDSGTHFHVESNVKYFLF